MAGLLNINDVSEDALHLKNMLDGVLERVQSVYQSYNVPLPQRQYWTMGQPAIDCEQLVVSLIQMYLGTPGQEATTPQRCHVPRSATISISVARQTAVVGMNGRPPSASQIEQSAYSSAVDAWILMECVNLFDTWDQGAGFGLGVIATLDVPDPQGGYNMPTLSITMAVP
jgi:hypothetical protein